MVNKSLNLASEAMATSWDFDQLRLTLEPSNAFCDDDSRILRF